MYTVVVSSLGRFSYLDELFDSISSQSLPYAEIILILTQTPSTYPVPSSFAIPAKCSIVYVDKNVSLASKRNLGASLSSQQFIIFSDDDDIWEPGKSLKSIRALSNYPVVCHNFSKFGFETRVACSKLGNKSRALGLNSLFFMGNVYGGGSSIATRKSVLEIFAFNPDSATEDYEWWSRIVAAKVPVFYIGESLVRYRTHNLNLTKNSGLMARHSLLLSMLLLRTASIVAASSLLMALKYFALSLVYCIKRAKA